MSAGASVTIAGRFQRDEEQASEAVSHGPNSRGPSLARVCPPRRIPAACSRDLRPSSTEAELDACIRGRSHPSTSPGAAWRGRNFREWAFMSLTLLTDFDHLTYNSSSSVRQVMEKGR